MIGFLLAAALFLVEAGWAELGMAEFQECAQRIQGMRIAPDPHEACASEFEIYLSKALSRGFVGVFGPKLSNGVAWSIMLLLYGLVGAAFSQLSLRHAVPGYLVVHLLLVLASMATGYLSSFIV